MSMPRSAPPAVVVGRASIRCRPGRGRPGCTRRRDGRRSLCHSSRSTMVTLAFPAFASRTTDVRCLSARGVQVGQHRTCAPDSGGSGALTGRPPAFVAETPALAIRSASFTFGELHRRTDLTAVTTLAGEFGTAACRLSSLWRVPLTGGSPWSRWWVTTKLRRSSPQVYDLSASCQGRASDSPRASRMRGVSHPASSRPAHRSPRRTDSDFRSSVRAPGTAPNRSVRRLPPSSRAAAGRRVCL